ncbi:MAG: hypothetical protein EHM91_06580, partial [Planctomycetota bacterium]
MMLLTLLLLMCQEDVYVRKIDKARYIEAVQHCKDAESKIDTDETLAIDKLTRILLDPTLTEVECTLRIQTSDIYGPPYLFLPYQYRARARMSLAKKTAATAEKKLLLEEAVQDLKTSAAKKVASSTKYLETAQAELKKLGEAATLDNPLVKLRPRWLQLVGERKFKSARALAEGGGLPEADRASLVAETDQACRMHLTEQMRQFRRNWTSVAALSDFQALTRDEFELSFALPPPDEIVVAHPAYDWARAHSAALRTLSSGKTSVAPMLAMAGDAARLEEGSDNPWFRLAEGLAYQDARREIERRIGESTDAPRARRETLVGEATAIQSAWKKFSDGLDAVFRSRNDSVVTHGAVLAGLFEKAPRDLPEIESEDLRSCFDGFPVDARLLAQEERLAAWEARGGISRESRQKLYTLLVAARSLRLFLAGKT